MKALKTFIIIIVVVVVVAVVVSSGGVSKWRWFNFQTIKLGSNNNIRHWFLVQSDGLKIYQRKTPPLVTKYLDCYTLINRTSTASDTYVKVNMRCTCIRTFGCSNPGLQVSRAHDIPVFEPVSERSVRGGGVLSHVGTQLLSHLTRVCAKKTPHITFQCLFYSRGIFVHKETRASLTLLF